MHTLRLFVDVARHRSFSQAATEHGITQSAASQRVNQLEKKLGVTLIDRSVRPLALTPAGELFLDGVGDLLERYTQLEQRVSRLSDQPQGQVRVDAIYSAGIDLLNQIKDRFEARFPDVTVTIEYKRPDEVVDAVKHQACDLGIVSYPTTWRDVGHIPLRDEAMAVVVAPTHPLASRRKVHASELSGEAMVTFEPELPAGRRIRRYLRDHHATPEITNVFDNIDTIKSAVAVTHEMSILPKRTVAREVKAGTLVVVELEPELHRPLGIIYRRRRGGSVFSPAAQRFADFLLEHAGPNVDFYTSIQAGITTTIQPQLVGGPT